MRQGEHAELKLHGDAGGNAHGEVDAEQDSPYMLNLATYRLGFLPRDAVQREAPARNDRVIELSLNDLPAVCPRRSMPLWAWHPRVFLDVVNQDEAMCPYCCTRYRLRVDVDVHDLEAGAHSLHQHRKQDRVDVEPRRGRTKGPLAASVAIPAEMPALA